MGLAEILKEYYCTRDFSNDDIWGRGYFVENIYLTLFGDWLGVQRRASISKGRRRGNFLLHTYQLQIQPFLSLHSISSSHLRIKIWNSTFKRGWRADVEPRWMDGNGCVQKSRGRGGRDWRSREIGGDGDGGSKVVLEVLVHDWLPRAERISQIPGRGRRRKGA